MFSIWSIMYAIGHNGPLRRKFPFLFWGSAASHPRFVSVPLQLPTGLALFCGLPKSIVILEVAGEQAGKEKACAHHILGELPTLLLFDLFRL